MSTCETINTRTAISALTVLLADDHAMLRDAVKAALTEEGFEVVAAVCDGKQAIEQCARLLPDVAVLDISMPVMDGFATTREIVRLCPNVKVVILTMHSGERYRRESLDSGASGFVLKADSATELADALRTVARGETYISLRALQCGLKETEVAPCVTEILADREREVLRLIAEGKSMKQIGNLLGISFKTVQSHRANIMTKLDIGNTAALVKYAVRSGLINP